MDLWWIWILKVMVDSSGLRVDLEIEGYDGFIRNYGGFGY